MTTQVERQPAMAGHIPISKHKLGYRVQSQSGQGHYIVNLDNADDPVCTCPDYDLRQKPCKHIRNVRDAIPAGREHTRDRWTGYHGAQRNRTG